MRPGLGARVAVGLAVTLVAGACTSDGGPGVGSGEGSPETIPQPVVENLAVAAESERVDIAMPTFSDPTNVTNPLFPVSQQASVLMLGHVDGKPFRTEVTLLPDTRIIEWQRQRVETLVSQYVAFLDGQIEEVAYDFYAQADDGSVWYFGEDVFDFRNGVIFGTQGTWTAGKDGPAAMIMPGDPKVGDVYRTENIPGVAFEEVTVGSVGETLEGPIGPIDGGLLGEELHADGTTEDKIFAPGYGEFSTAGGGDLEALALAVPTDALDGPVPAELVTLETGAADVFEAARSGDWRAASIAVEGMTVAWHTYGAGEVPRMIEPRMTRTLQALAAGVDAHDGETARRRRSRRPGGVSTLSCPIDPSSRSTWPASSCGRPNSSSTLPRATRPRSAATSSRSTTSGTGSCTPWIRPSSLASTPSSRSSRARRPTTIWLRRPWPRSASEAPSPVSSSRLERDLEIRSREVTRSCVSTHLPLIAIPASSDPGGPDRLERCGRQTWKQTDRRRVR